MRPLPWTRASCGDDERNVIKSIAHGNHSTGMEITIIQTFVPRLSWAYVYAKARTNARQSYKQDQQTSNVIDQLTLSEDETPEDDCIRQLELQLV